MVGFLRVHAEEEVNAASHRAQNTDAIITTDGVLNDAGYDTIWE